MIPDTPSSIPMLPIRDADPKPWYASRGVLGALAVILSQCAALIGVHLDAPALTELAMQAVGLIGGILALIGRIGAEQPIRPPL